MAPEEQRYRPGGNIYSGRRKGFYSQESVNGYLQPEPPSLLIRKKKKKTTDTAAGNTDLISLPFFCASVKKTRTRSSLQL